MDLLDNPKAETGVLLKRVVVPTVAVLCVSRNSVYKSLENVVCYDAECDVRTFAGGMPIVAHPPCRSWSAFCAHQAKPFPGEKALGPVCVSWLQECGGVLEHPAHSKLFDACQLPMPGETRDGMWTIEVLQSLWGHEGTAKKTWLCFCGIERRQIRLPLTLRSPGGDKRLWQTMPRKLRSATCQAMAEWLVDVARCSRHNAKLTP